MEILFTNLNGKCGTSPRINSFKEQKRMALIAGITVSINHYYPYFIVKLFLNKGHLLMFRFMISTLFIAAFIFLLTTSCTTEYVKEAARDGKYDSEFPYSSASDELEEISRTVKLINSMAFYRRFVFARTKQLKAEEINESVVDNGSMFNERFTKMSSGTGTILESTSNQLILLTAAHILNFADTVITYFSDSNGKKTEIVQSISFKQDQNIYSNLPKGGELEIIMLDEKNDVALVGMKNKELIPFDYQHPTFEYPIGYADELTWGNFVYIFGFPVNNKMLTRAIVSRPNKTNTRTFMVDAVLNRGASGGIVLAVRDGVPNFELVGIVSRISAARTFVLIPEELFNDQSYQLDSRYEGNQYIGEIEEIKYGLTKVVTVESIRKSIYDHAIEIRDKGYNLPRRFALEENN